MQALRITKRHDCIVAAVHQQHRAACFGHAVDGRYIVKVCAYHALHMAQHIPAQYGVWQMHLCQKAAHHFTWMRKGTQADDGAQVRPARSAQERCSGTHGVANKGQARAINLGLKVQPVQPGFDVLGESWQRGERFVITFAMATRIQQ